MKKIPVIASQQETGFTETFETFIQAMMRQYHLRREDVLLGIHQFGMIIRTYCRIAADLKKPE
jgi:hypothetical protein